MFSNDLIEYLDTLEENFLTGKIPYDQYKKTILAYELWKDQEPQTEN